MYYNEPKRLVYAFKMTCWIVKIMNVKASINQNGAIHRIRHTV